MRPSLSFTHQSTQTDTRNSRPRRGLSNPSLKPPRKPTLCTLTSRPPCPPTTRRTPLLLDSHCPHRLLSRIRRIWDKDRNPLAHFRSGIHRGRDRGTEAGGGTEETERGARKERTGWGENSRIQGSECRIWTEEDPAGHLMDDQGRGEVGPVGAEWSVQLPLSGSQYSRTHIDLTLTGSGKSTLLSLLLGDHPRSYMEDLWLFGKPRDKQATATRAFILPFDPDLTQITLLQSKKTSDMSAPKFSTPSRESGTSRASPSRR